MEDSAREREREFLKVFARKQRPETKYVQTGNEFRGPRGGRVFVYPRRRGACISMQFRERDEVCSREGCFPSLVSQLVLRLSPLILKTMHSQTRRTHLCGFEATRFRPASRQPIPLLFRSYFASRAHARDSGLRVHPSRRSISLIDSLISPPSRTLPHAERALACITVSRDRPCTKRVRVSRDAPPRAETTLHSRTDSPPVAR